MNDGAFDLNGFLPFRSSQFRSLDLAIPSSLSLYLLYMKYIHRVVAKEPTNEAATRGRESRQQSGDTYTLEIAFPAVKYVPMHNYMRLLDCLLASKLNGFCFCLLVSLDGSALF